MWTLRQANLHSPEAIQNRIVRQIDQLQGGNQLVTSEIFPLVELSDSRETYFTRDGLRSEMRRTDMASESPVGDIEDLGEEEVTVETFKKKISPEKGVDTELNSQEEILNLFNATADALMEDVLMTRARVAWQSALDGSIDGVLGLDGQTAHPDIPSSHVITPSARYDDLTASKPVNDLMDAEHLISEDGNKLSQAGGITIHAPPSVIRDWKTNENLTSEYDSVAAFTQDQLGDIFQVDAIRPIRTKLPRVGTNGEYIDENGNPVEEPSQAVDDNVLEPYDASADIKRRNVLVSAPGQVTAFMPWFLDRLQEMGSQSPHGDVSVDGTNGWMTQTWTTNDPITTWFAAKQEIGYHVQRGENMVVIQDV